VSVGPAEIIIVLILALLVFGPKRLPQMGRSLGKGVREFRKAADTAKQEFGLGEVTDQIGEVKSTITEPFKDVKGTFGDLKEAIDVKSAIEAPVKTAAAAGAAGAAATPAAATPAAAAPAAATPAAATPDNASTEEPATEAAAQTPADQTPAASAATPQIVASDAAPTEPTEPAGAPEAPPAPEAPEEVTAGPPASATSGA
jgi:TatA/E family protein of Tat protein translocase